MALPPTPSQTIGPFYHFALPFPGAERLVDPGDPDAVRIAGTVYDGAGEPVTDAMVEIWQANRSGRYAHPEDDRDDLPLEEGFTGFGRCPTDGDGRYEFVTVKPGVVPGPGGRPQAPHIDVLIFARGLLRQLVTRIYFPDEEAANASDPLLSSIEDPAAHSTLVARQVDGAFEFDIHLAGDNQTTFFDV
ncbi:MAG TPA: protocatechuate 3,4-dioxygenase subunit alpha [Rubrobacteraceae bacterium]|nr:protocatechuate 3,4-dioxygenase subunit alpha [Rubrobacteraceae bacterium]